MQPYQNYLNNGYVQGLQNQIQNYQQALNNLQQQIAPANGITAQIVDSFDSISANAVPMDNLGAIFMLRDGSEIQTRRWTPDGKITMKSYKAILGGLDAEMDKVSTDAPKSEIWASDEVTGALQTILDRLDLIEGLVTPKKTTPRKAKEGDTE